MKRNLIILVFIVTLPLFTISAELPLSGDMLELDLSLRDLSLLSAVELDNLINSNKYIVIDGTISSITEIERSENDVILDIHLVSGRWIGLDKVENYKCIVNVEGLEWGSRFPKRTPRVVTDEMLLQNYQILVIGRVSSYVMEDSILTAVVDGEFIRRIQ